MNFVCRKTLFSEVHNFIHLNLSLALLLGLIVFVAGIETAVVNEVCVYLNYVSENAFKLILN